MDHLDVEAAVRTYNKEVQGTPNPIFITSWELGDGFVEVKLFSPQVLLGWPHDGMLRANITHFPDFRAFLDMLRTASGYGSERLLKASEVKWIVNDNAELGVQIGDQCFFYYQGRSLSYPNGKHDNGEPRKYRPVASTEYGDTIPPVTQDGYGGLIGVLPFFEGHEWSDLPPDPHNVESVA